MPVVDEQTFNDGLLMTYIYIYAFLSLFSGVAPSHSQAQVSSQLTSQYRINDITLNGTMSHLESFDETNLLPIAVRKECVGV